MHHHILRDTILCGLVLGLFACAAAGGPPQMPSGQLVTPTPKRLVRASTPVSPNACCADALCDRAAFAKNGGTCPGDPRINGPLPPRAVVIRK